MTLAAQGRFTVTSPRGIAFSEFKGSDAWRVIALSETDEGCLEGRCVKAIRVNAGAIGGAWGVRPSVADSSRWAATVAAGLTDGIFAAADAVHVAGHMEPSRVGRR